MGSRQWISATFKLEVYRRLSSQPHSAYQPGRRAELGKCDSRLDMHPVRVVDCRELLSVSCDNGTGIGAPPEICHGRRYDARNEISIPDSSPEKGRFAGSCLIPEPARENKTSLSIRRVPMHRCDRGAGSLGLGTYCGWTVYLTASSLTRSSIIPHIFSLFIVFIL